MAERGVVTLCDRNYYPGVRALHASIQASLPVRVACFDVGLTPEQRAEAATVPNLVVLDLPDDPLIARWQAVSVGMRPLNKPGKRTWPLWIRPLLIAAAPFEALFWLDADLLVLRGLDEMFAMLADGPVFTPENKAPAATPNAPSLYELMPIARTFDRARPLVNSGVSGWLRGRDDALLAAFIEVVRRAAEDAAIRGAIAWHDQGALIWAIQSVGAEHRVLESWDFNLSVAKAGLPEALLSWDDSLPDRLRAALPAVRVLHWNGRKAPWLS